MRKLHIACILFIALGSCSKKLDLPDVARDRKIALLGELVANEPVYFRAGQSVPVSSSSSMNFEILKGLSINLTDNAGVSTTLAGNEDSLSKYLFTTPFTSGTIIKAGVSYRITATHPERETAMSDIVVPDAFTASVKGMSSAIYASDTTLAIDLQIEDQPGEQYYVIEALKQPMTITARFLYDNNWLNIDDNRVVYDSLKQASITMQMQFDTVFSGTFKRQYLRTADANTENMRSNTSFNLFRRVLLTDQKFSGSNYNTRVYLSIARDFFASEADKGRILLQVKSVSKDYFDYLMAYELYNPNSEYFMSGTPANLKSPVQNGMGIVGGVYKQQFVFVLDTWEF